MKWKLYVGSTRIPTCFYGLYIEPLFGHVVVCSDSLVYYPICISNAL